MRRSVYVCVLLACLLPAVSVRGEQDYGLYHYNFDDDPLVENCTKPKPVIFNLMVDFLTMIKGESNRAMQTCVREGKGPGFMSPPGVARTIFAATTMAYNTYARYNQQAIPLTMYEGWTRMPQAQQKVPDCVYIYAFYQIADYLMPERLAYFGFKGKYETNYNCTLTLVAENASSQLGLVQKDVNQLKAQLRVDGFNQEGCFADTSNYKAVNPPCRLDNRTTIEMCRNFTHTYDTIWKYGEFVKTGYVNNPRRTALSQAQQCKPFSLGKLYDYLAAPYFGAASFENGTVMNLTDQFLEVVEIQKHLDENNDRPKLIAEYWAGGPNTTGTPGHWLSISLNIIRRLCYDNDQAVKLLFTVSAAIYDAGLAAWQNKRLYDTVRPAVYIPTEHIDAKFEHQFVGMYCNFMDIQGWQWSPYQENRVITPEFQEYISGHSTFSRAASVVLEQFTGSPNVPGNLTVTIKAGQSLFQPRCSRSNSTCYVQCRVNSSLDSENNYLPKVDVTLGPYKTYRDIANEASISRKYGGIHIASGDIQGRLVGQKVGEMVWTKVAALFNDSKPFTSNSNKLQFHYIFYLTILYYL